MSSSGRYNRNWINIIAPKEAESPDTNNSNKSKSIIVAGKKYCPVDQALLVFRADLDSFFCTICGFLDNPKAKMAPLSSPTTSISSSPRGENPEDNITMQIVPLETKPRTRYTENWLSDDPHIRALQMKGYQIIDHQETVDDTGTFNTQEIMEQKRRLFTTNRLTSSSYSVY